MKNETSYEIPILGIKIGSHAFEWRLDEAFLIGRGVDAFSKADLVVSLLMDRKERLINLDFSIEGSVATICDRCGDPIETDIATDDHLIVRFAQVADLTDDEVVFVDESAHHLDVGQFIYEYIMVGLPSRFVHDSGECNPEVEKYLGDASRQSTEKKNDNIIDPRWEALKKFKQ